MPSFFTGIQSNWLTMPRGLPIVNFELNENMEFAHSPSNLPSGPEPTSSLGRRHSDLEPPSRWKILALRRQLAVLRRSVKRSKRITTDRRLSVWPSQVSVDWRSSLLILEPETGI